MSPAIQRSRGSLAARSAVVRRRRDGAQGGPPSQRAFGANAVSLANRPVSPVTPQTRFSALRWYARNLGLWVSSEALASS